jgi:hypothetical protein
MHQLTCPFERLPCGRDSDNPEIKLKNGESYDIAIDRRFREYDSCQYTVFADDMVD